MLVCVSVSVQTLRMTVADSSSCGWTSSLPACVNIIITMFLDIFVVILRSLLFCHTTFSVCLGDICVPIALWFLLCYC